MDGVVDGVTAVLKLFERHPLVALGEMHGVEQGARFIEQLVRHRDFAASTTIIVVEFGNALHQAVADAYVAGEDVPPAQLRRIWHDFIGGGPWGFRSPIYPAFFATVRDVNRSLPHDRRIRVLLGDPPLDWSTTHTTADFHAALRDRDTHCARVVAEHVVREHERALLLYGAFHLLRRHPLAGPETLAQLIERDHPLFTIMPHDGIGPGCEELEARFASWPIPGLCELSRTWLADHPAEAVLGNHGTVPSPDGTRSDPFAASGLKLGELFDAYLYLGPRAALTEASANWVAIDDADRTELKRRYAVSRFPEGMPD